MKLEKKLKQMDRFFNKPITSGEFAWGLIHELVHQILTHYPKARISKKLDPINSIDDYAKLLKKYNLRVKIEWIPEDKI